MNLETVRILLADDHDVVRKGVRAMLEGRGKWQVCGEATSGKDAVTLCAELRPHIAVLDVEMGDLDGIEVVRKIKENVPQIEMLIFTMHDSEYLIREALAAGARGFVLKSEGGRKLIEAIDAVLEHRPFFAARASETLLNSLLRSRGPRNEICALTGRECEVVKLLADAKSNKEAAVALGISVKTVETHRSTIMRKLGFNSVVELVRYAVRERLIKA